MKIMKFCIYTILSVFLLQCQQSKEEIVTQETSQKIENTISKKEISNLNYKEYLIDQKAKKDIQLWLKYNDLNTEIERLKAADFSFFTDNAEVINSFLDELKSSLPETLNNNAIQARLLILETSFLKFESVMNVPISTKTERLSNLKSIFVAFSNLNFQINKKIERESQQIEKP